VDILTNSTAISPDHGGGNTGIEQVIADDLGAFRGPWVEQLRMRATYVLEGQTAGFAVVLFWRASGLMALGMGLYSSVERTGQVTIVAGIWAFQLIASPLWRSLTYGRAQSVMIGTP
jgi:hypothetical protein